MRSVLNPQAGATATGLVLGALAISGAVALVTAPITPHKAVAQTVDQGSVVQRSFQPGASFVPARVLATRGLLSAD